MTELAVATSLSPDDARSLTDEVKLDAERLWGKLVQLYDGGAHTALKYDSWGDYFAAEFGQSRWQGYELLRAGRVVGELPTGGPQPTSHRQARELAPLLDDPEALREAWQEASEEGAPTAAKVREAVEKRHPRSSGPTLVVPIDEELLERQQRQTLIRQLDHAVYSLESPPSAAEAEAHRLLAGGDSGPFTPARFDRVVAYASAFAQTLREAGVDG